MWCFSSCLSFFSLRCLPQRKVSSLPRLEKRVHCIPARKVECYDGDTITLAVVVDGITFKRRCRMRGFDSPELRGADADPAAAKAARQHLDSIAPSGTFWIQSFGHDKYGRLLVDWRLRNGALASEEMIRSGHGYAYDGGKKRVRGSEGAQNTDAGTPSARVHASASRLSPVACKGRSEET